MRRKNVTRKLAVVILSAAMAMSPVMSTMPVYAAGEATENTASTSADAATPTETNDADPAKDTKTASFTMKGTNYLTGIKNSDEVFHFVVKDQQTGKKDTYDVKGNEPIPYKTLTFDKPGHYTYYVEQEPGSTLGYIYDVTRVSAFTVNVTEENGKLVATSSPDRMDFWNSYVEPISIAGQITWDDHDNQNKARPDSVTLTLKCTGGKYKDTALATKTVTAADGWSYDFGKYQKIDNMTKATGGYRYTVEEDPIDGYTAVRDGLKITNTANDVTTDVSGTIRWDDNGDHEGTRPKKMDLTLYAYTPSTGNKAVKTITLSADSNNGDTWHYTFPDVPKVDGNDEIHYTVSSPDIDKYGATTVDGINILYTSATQPAATTSVSGKIIWDDDENRDGIRPKETEIVLKADGKEVQTVKTDTDSYSFKDVPVKDEKTDKDVVYTVEEKSVDGYKTTYDGFNITNKHEIAKTAISGKVLWDDANDNDGIRPKEVEVTLTADGKEVKTIKVSDGSYDFGEVPVNADGKKITYKVSEKDIDGYTISYSAPSSDTAGVDITNKHEIAKTDVSARVVWNDKDNQDKVRPASVTLQLTADGEKYGKAVPVLDSDGWKYVWKDVPVKKNGKAVSYKVTQDAVDKYTTEASMDGQTYVFTNTHNPIEKVSVTGTVTWIDNNNGAKKRPNKVTIILTRDGKEIDRKTVSSSDSWKYDFGKVDKTDANGKTYTYEIKEGDVNGYDISVKGFDVTNTLKKSDDSQKKDDKGGKTDNTTDGKSTGDEVSAVPFVIAAGAAFGVVAGLVSDKKKKKAKAEKAENDEK